MPWLSIVSSSGSLGCVSRLCASLLRVKPVGAAAVRADGAWIRSLSLPVVQLHLCAEYSSFCRLKTHPAHIDCMHASPSGGVQTKENLSLQQGKDITECLKIQYCQRIQKRTYSSATLSLFHGIRGHYCLNIDFFSHWTRCILLVIDL